MIKDFLDNFYGRVNTTTKETVRHALGFPFIAIGILFMHLGALIAGEN